MIHIIVANSTHAKLFVNFGINDSVHQADEKIYEFKKPSELKDHDDGYDKSSARGVHMLQSFEPQTDERTKQRDDIAKSIAEHINKRASEIEKLVVVAPPQLLGHLREHFSKQTQQVIIAELDKDLTQVAEQELPQHLSDVAAMHDPVNDFDYERAKQFTAT